MDFFKKIRYTRGIPVKGRYTAMAEANNNGAIQLFEDKKIRTAWDAEQEEWYFSVVDVLSVLTDQKTPRSASTYWAVLKKRLKDEGADELLTNCKQLKMTAADGKKRLTDVANTEKARPKRSGPMQVQRTKLVCCGFSLPGRP